MCVDILMFNLNKSNHCMGCSRDDAIDPHHVGAQVGQKSTEGGVFSLGAPGQLGHPVQ